MRAIYPVFRALLPNQVIRADDLARAMVDVVVRRNGEPGDLVFENRDIRAMVESQLSGRSRGFESVVCRDTRAQERSGFC